MRRLILEMGPLVVFFLANSYGEQLAALYPVLQALGGKIFIGTAFFMIAMAISLVLTWILEKRIATMPLVTAVFVLVFGGLTLYLQDDTFIKVKPTIVNCLFGTAILFSLFILKKPLLKLLFHGPFELDDQGWHKLSLRFGLFFFALAALNEIVWRNFSSDFWVNFKVWGIMPITLAFTAFQMPLMNRHMIEDKSDEKN